VPSSAGGATCPVILPYSFSFAAVVVAIVVAVLWVSSHACGCLLQQQQQQQQQQERFRTRNCRGFISPLFSIFFADLVASIHQGSAATHSKRRSRITSLVPCSVTVDRIIAAAVAKTAAALHAQQSTKVCVCDFLLFFTGRGRGGSGIYRTAISRKTALFTPTSVRRRVEPGETGAFVRACAFFGMHEVPWCRVVWGARQFVSSSHLEAWRRSCH